MQRSPLDVRCVEVAWQVTQQYRPAALDPPRAVPAGCVSAPGGIGSSGRRTKLDTGGRWFVNVVCFACGRLAPAVATCRRLCPTDPVGRVRHAWPEGTSAQREAPERASFLLGGCTQGWRSTSHGHRDVPEVTTPVGTGTGQFLTPISPSLCRGAFAGWDSVISVGDDRLMFLEQGLQLFNVDGRKRNILSYGEGGSGTGSLSRGHARCLHAQG